MPAIDRWVVRQACTRLAHRRGDATCEPYVLAINISSTTLNDEQFLDFVVAELASADLTPGALCFELTESAAMTSLAAATHFIRELRDRGCRFSLDDFGSGLSSFIFLKNLPVDFLKLDGQFMHNVTHDHIDRSMVEAIAQIGESMGIQHRRRAGRLGRSAGAARRHRHPVRAGPLHQRAAAGRGPRVPGSRRRPGTAPAGLNPRPPKREGSEGQSSTRAARLRSCSLSARLRSRIDDGVISTSSSSSMNSIACSSV